MYFRWGAILATHGIEGAVVVRAVSEAAALELWRKELVSGNRIACLGTASAAEARSVPLCLSFLAHIYLIEAGLRRNLAQENVPTRARGKGIFRTLSRESQATG